MYTNFLTIHLVCFSLFFNFLAAQNTAVKKPSNVNSCSFYDVMVKNNQYAALNIKAFEANERFTQSFIKKLRAKKNAAKKIPDSYTIPVVLHIFHNGEEGRISEAQARSSIDVLNADFLGLNDDFNSVIPRFDSIKATIDINFCLATIDPQGNPSNGINYYDNEAAAYNEVDLNSYAWDNYSYLNIYLPKYAYGGPSDYTAYAYFPSTVLSNNNQDGITHSSYRWGLGSMSELTTEDDRISVITHEVGHWLNLFHTFENGCNPPGDYVDDTPPSIGGDPAPSGCHNFNFTCDVFSNGSNYMDYNLDCKRMFTKGQVERMQAALQLPERSPLWSAENLIATGCQASIDCGNLTASFSGLPTSAPIQNFYTLVGSPDGGTFSGPGISFNVFNTADLLAGFHTINYNYTDANGCNASSNQNILIYTITYNFVNYFLQTIQPKQINNLDFELDVLATDHYTFNIFDIQGRQLLTSHKFLEQGFYQEQFSLNNSLGKGVFFVQVSTSKYSETRKFYR